MIILISPAKIMKVTGTMKPRAIPSFSQASVTLLQELKTLSAKELMQLMRIKEVVALENMERYKKINMDLHGTCALQTYDGIQFKSMQLDTANASIWQYLQDHVYVLSGLYGFLRPFDSIYPYRLEMQTKLNVHDYTDLYGYWRDKLAVYINEKHKDEVIINLMSKEYANACTLFQHENKWIDIGFLTNKQGVMKTQSTQVKKARGMMVRWMAENDVQDVIQMKQFSLDGYAYAAHLSNEKQLIFVKSIV